MGISTDAVWAYAVIGRDDAEARVGGLRGVADEPIRVVGADQLVAVVGTVGLDEFGEEALCRNLEDLDWLAATARAHDGVISAVARFGAVVPLRMATVYLDDDRVRQLLESRRVDFIAALDRVSGRAELGVKAYADPALLGGCDEAAEIGSGQKISGTAYLMRRRRALMSREEAYRVASEAAERIHARLMEYAVDGKRKPVSDRSLSNRKAWTVLNGSYLVDTQLADAFEAAVADVGHDMTGIELKVTGPWPPYSFAGDVAGR